MLLGFGMISLTILDVAYLIGLLILGLEISALLEPLPVTFTLNTDMSYTEFIKKYKGKRNTPIDDQKRAAFYLVWPC